jgi:hypothetical protein
MPDFQIWLPDPLGLVLGWIGLSVVFAASWSVLKLGASQCGCPDCYVQED